MIDALFARAFQWFEGLVRTLTWWFTAPGADEAWS